MMDCVFACITQALCHQGKDLTNKPFLQALAAREENVRNGKLTVQL
jgi:hypothetical protein